VSHDVLPSTIAAIVEREARPRKGEPGDDAADARDVALEGGRAVSLEPDAITYTHQQHRAAAAPLRIDDWAPIAAVQGVGSLLLGPHEQGAQAIVPPATLARTPRDSDDEYSETGWRLSVWEFLDDRQAYIEGSRPLSLTPISFDQAVGLVRSEAPEYEEWLVRQVDQRILCLTVLVEHADPGEERQAVGWKAELDDLLLDATRAFGEAWVRRTVAPPPR
jgi:hypothetical protein